MKSRGFGDMQADALLSIPISRESVSMLIDRGCARVLVVTDVAARMVVAK